MYFFRKMITSKTSLAKVFLFFFAGLSFLYAAYIAIKYSGQLPLDLYSFRQTQTAITSYWFYKEGFKLAYETPVGGLPWSIPFEFPLYQYIAAMVAKATSLPLEVAGRLTSFAFLIFCLIPARAIIRDLKLGERSFPIFTILLLTSPLYLYWGRTFMIETTSLFFSVAAISFFVKMMEKGGVKISFAFLLCMSIGILQKATTGLPVLAVLGIVYFFKSLRDLREASDHFGKEEIYFTFRRSLYAAFYIGIPLMVGVAWTYYTDQVKLLNPLGAHLTSAALHTWNWGTPGQRLSKNLYEDVIWHRMFLENMGGTLGAAILLLGFSRKIKNSARISIFVSSAMGFAPFFLFSNLHIIHTYYQSANLIFLIFALAVSLSHLTIGGASLVLTMIIAISNIHWFHKDFKSAVEETFDSNNSRDVAVAEVVRQKVPEDKSIVVFGNDWSSSISYLAERKSYTVPQFVPHYEALSADPTNFMAAPKLGGVVLCDGVQHPTLAQLQDWSSARGWQVARVSSCYVSFP